MAETTNSTIYIAGDNGKYPVLWKNGVEQRLSESEGYGSQVILAGNDIYVAGIVDESGELLPSGPSGQYVYWKNGIPVKIGKPVFLRSGNASVSRFSCVSVNQICEIKL